MWLCFSHGEQITRKRRADVLTPETRPALTSSKSSSPSIRGILSGDKKRMRSRARRRVSWASDRKLVQEYFYYKVASDAASQAAKRQSLSVSSMFGIGGGGMVNGKEKWVPDANQEMEFYCDMCDKTIAKGQVRHECSVCTEEFCMCQECILAGVPHPHPLLPNVTSVHITKRTSTSALVHSAFR